MAVEVPRITQRQVHRNNSPHTTPEEYYRRVVFIPMLNSVISDLKSRISRDTLNSFRLTVLVPSNIVNCTDDLLQTSVKKIFSMCRLPVEHLFWQRCMCGEVDGFGLREKEVFFLVQ